MATAPKINLRDGTGTTQELVFTTNLEFIVVEGLVDANTVAMQVSVNNAPFTSDPTLIELDGLNFTFPNPVSYPDGFPLEFGVYTIRFRSIDIVGSVSAISTVTVTRVATIAASGDLIPTGVKVRRRRNAVDILAAKVPAGDQLFGFEFRGFNIYASTSPSGTTGYFRVNDRPVTEQSTVFDEDLLAVDSSQVVFTPTTNTTTIRVRLTEENNFGTETALILDRRTSLGAISGELKFAQTLQSRVLTQYYSFRHNRLGGLGILNSDQWADVPDTDPLYYVVTAIYFDTVTTSELETPYSQEVLGLPFVIDTAIRDLPARTQLQVLLDFVDAIQRVNQEITLIPGSTTRDVSIDPFASEAERIWFIVDFVHRSQSFLTLLQIDDANGDGVSDPVVSSSYKQAVKAALGFQSDSAVQTLINTQFDKLAGNFQRTRLPGRPSVGQAVFFTTTRPTRDITIGSGSIVASDVDADNGLPAVRFSVGGTFVFSAANAAAFFNFNTQRYEITVDIVAQTVGASGNRSAGSIKNVVTPVGGLQVTNTEATVFGTDQESNLDLATRAELGFVSVDTGTEGGYAATSAAQIGIIKSKIVKSGDALMMRDYDDVRHKHIGGKVDVWVQGLRERTVSERFAFTFSVARDIRCQIIDVTNLIFRVLDPQVTVDTPIVEILDNSAQGFGVRNATKGQDYDLTGVTILDHETFQVSTAVSQPVTALDDVVIADFRFRALNIFTFSFQPVRRVTSVSGEISGPLDPLAGYQLYKTDDPLLEGESTIAKNYLVINQIGGVPSGVSITVNDERHTMIGFFEEPIKNIGVNTATLRVFNVERTIEYDGPGTSDPDFEIIEGTATTPSKILRTSTSTILSGQVVSVDYDHDENFTVTYVINDLLQQLQRTINSRRHITGDVLVKQAILNSVAIETTIQLKKGATKDKADPAVRSSVSLELNQKIIGQGSAQSDIINAIDSTTGVDFQVIPLARMGYADGSLKLRETVQPSSARVSSLDLGGQQVFILTNALRYPTTDGGGLSTEHEGVFQDDESLALSSLFSNVGQNPNQAYIIGAEGKVITGYSDDATLLAEGFLTAEAIEAERRKRTGNHVLVSLSGAGSPSDAPENHSYAVSYVIRNDKGPHDITASEVEFIDLGDFSLTFREAT
jgi:hypothetical protein